MVDYSAELFQQPVSSLDSRECLRLSKRIARDGYGTRYPWPGYIGQHFGETRYNGGCIRNGTWYQGEYFPLPIVAKDFTLEHVPMWGWRIVQ